MQAHVKYLLLKKGEASWFLDHYMYGGFLQAFRLVVKWQTHNILLFQRTYIVTRISEGAGQSKVVL